MEQSYKEKYEDVLARLERAKNDNEVCDERFCCVINEIIPELAESEDEKIRKWIVDDITFNMNNEPLNNSEYRKKAEKAIAWLEKQKEYESTDFEYVWDRTDCGELTAALDKYSEEAIINMCHAWYDKGIELERKSWLEKQGQVKESTISQHENKMCKENDDSLTYDDERIRKEIINYFQCQSEEEPTRKEIHDKWIAWLGKQGEQKPADKVEPKFKVGDKIRRKTPSSFDKDMQVARIEKDYYVCNHIGKFSSEVVPFSKQSSYELVEPKQGWRAEDEAVLDALIRRLKGEDIYVSPHLAVECLESLKGRVLPKQEWSEDDEQHIDSLLKRLDALCRNKFERTRFAISEDRDWLKSLRPQNKWKPSDEQIAQLQIVVDTYGNEGIYDPILTELLFQLKKIKGEV